MYGRGFFTEFKKGMVMSMGKIKNEFKERVENNSKNYSPKDLFDLSIADAFLEQMYKKFGLATLMTDRHGTVVQVHGEFGDFKPDVVNDPGMKIRVKGRTVCQLFVKFEEVEESQSEVVKVMLDAYIKTLEGYSEKSYLCSEQAMYIDELEQAIERDTYQEKYSEGTDPLTGVLNKSSFLKSVEELEQREVIPTAVICVNINDWLFVDENYGEEESDRLIVTIAEILEKQAKEQTIIGRMGGDGFQVLIPMTDEDAAREYCRRVKEACLQYDDKILFHSFSLYKNV